MYFAEDGDGVDGGAVPAAAAELLLALAYRDDGARLDRVHHLDVASTDVLLLAHQSYQAVALVLRPDVRQRARRRYRPDTIMAATASFTIQLVPPSKELHEDLSLIHI